MTPENISPATQQIEQNSRPDTDLPFLRPMAIWALLAISLPLFFFRMGGWAFFEPDEGRYAELPREMLKSGDWITPHLNGVVYFEKPPLLYWAVAAMYRLFGLHEWSGRMVPALAALAGVLLVYGLGRRMFGARAGLLGALACDTSILWILSARELVIDMLFSALIIAGLAFWWLGHTAENAGRSRNDVLAMWLSVAGAMLAKGPVTLMVIFAIVVCYLVCCGQTKTGRSGLSWPGFLLFLLVTAPWFVLVQLRNPGFDHFFWYGQNVGRFLGIGVNREHAEPFWYFLMLWWPAFFPWSLFVPGALIAFRNVIWPFRIGDSRTPRRRAALFCFIAFFGVTLFFSASTSKLPQYVLPALPAAAVLIGAYFDACLRRGRGAFSAALWSGVGLYCSFSRPRPRSPPKSAPTHCASPKIWVRPGPTSPPRFLPYTSSLSRSARCATCSMRHWPQSSAGRSWWRSSSFHYSVPSAPTTPWMCSPLPSSQASKPTASSFNTIPILRASTSISGGPRRLSKA